MRANSLFFIALALPVFTALAAEPTVSTVGDLSLVQSETIMYEAQAKRAEAKVKMLELTARAGDDPRSTKDAATPIVPSEVPSVTGVSGSAGRLLATICYSNGATVKSPSGQTIPGGFVVTEITIDRVVVARGDRRIPLQFVTACNATQSTAQPQPKGSTFPGQITPISSPSPALMH